MGSKISLSCVSEGIWSIRKIFFTFCNCSSLALQCSSNFNKDGIFNLNTASPDIRASDNLMVGGSKSQMVGGSNTEIQSKKDEYTISVHNIGASGQITIRSGATIFIEAPTIVSRGNQTSILTDRTYIAGDLYWNGEAVGLAKYASKAKEIGTVQEFPIPPVPRENPNIPFYSPPTPPSAPDSPVSPPAPPKPPEYDYDDDPPKVDECKK